jgi:hypothetical protein
VELDPVRYDDPDTALSLAESVTRHTEAADTTIHQTRDFVNKLWHEQLLQCQLMNNNNIHCEEESNRKWSYLEAFQG